MGKKEEKKVYNFGEKETENKLPVYQMPKYKESKAKAIEMIEKGKYGLQESDFWILMNMSKNKDKMLYSGLIISHNGCLKINEQLDNKVNPKCFTIDKEGFNNSLVFTYIDEDTYEVGEFNSSNCKNAYPYAMAFKRCFDRVVLKKSKLAFSGIYSEVEADEFKGKNEEIEEIKYATEEQITMIVSLVEDIDSMLNYYKIKDIKELTEKQASEIIKRKTK